MRIKHALFSAGAVLTLTGSVFMFQAAYASAYEWLSYETFAATDGSCCTSGENLTVKWDINTSANYYEYRNAYYATTTIYDTTTPPDSAWIEYGSGACRHEGNINGNWREGCYPNAPTVSAPSILWTRYSTNYQMCGGYTPTPDVVNCGDIFTTTSTITP